MTKQQRMVGYLYKTFDEVTQLGLKGNFVISNILDKDEFQLYITLVNYKNELVFEEIIKRDNCKYSTFCNRIIELEKQLRKFGENYQED